MYDYSVHKITDWTASKYTFFIQKCVIIRITKNGITGRYGQHNIWVKSNFLSHTMKTFWMILNCAKHCCLYFPILCPKKIFIASTNGRFKSAILNKYFKFIDSEEKSLSSVEVIETKQMFAWHFCSVCTNSVHFI